jgi:hypothetical protein
VSIFGYNLLFVIVDLTSVGFCTAYPIVSPLGGKRETCSLLAHISKLTHTPVANVSLFTPPLSLFLEYEQINDIIIML